MARPPEAPPPAARVLYWHDPMVPGQKFDKPGKSPFMDMQLVPVYARRWRPTEAFGAHRSARAAEPRRAHRGGRKASRSARALEAVGSVAYNERDVALVQARANGFVEKLHRARAARPRARGPAAGRALRARLGRGAGGVPRGARAWRAQAPARRCARARASACGSPACRAAQIAAVEAGGRIQPRLTLVAPIGGVVGELGAREGMTVAPGAPLFRINGLDTVWVNAEVPESAGGRRAPGTAVEAQRRRVSRRDVQAAR